MRSDDDLKISKGEGLLSKSLNVFQVCFHFLIYMLWFSSILLCVSRMVMNDNEFDRKGNEVNHIVHHALS